MGKPSRDKGLRSEREICKLLNGERVPLSGAAGGSYTGDIVVPYLGVGEVKRRANGFKRLYDWLGENDFLAIRADRREWLVVIKAADAVELLEELDGYKKIDSKAANKPEGGSE